MRVDHAWVLGLARAIAAPSRRTARLIAMAPIVVTALAACAALYPREAVPAPAPVAVPASHVVSLAARVELVGERLSAVERLHARDIAPIERVLRSYRNDARLARQVALALVREGRRHALEPRLLLALLLVENPMLDPAAHSPVGAIGLMQVMPLHRGHWPCEPRLEEIEANICHGAAIFAHYLDSERGNVERALLRYNGCVRGTNTPNCQSYPSWVFQRAGRASVLAWLRDAAPRERT